MLRALGTKAIVARLAVSVYVDLHHGPVGVSSHRIAQLQSGFAAWCDEDLDWLLDGATLGASLTQGAVPKRVTATIVAQVAGAFELCNDDRWAEFVTTQYLRERVDLTGSDLLEKDPKTLLQECLAPDVPAYVYEVEGPDHSRLFRAIVSARAGRKAWGEGRRRRSPARMRQDRF